MTQQIEAWLNEKLGICLSLDSPDIGEKLFEGHVFVRLLTSYGIINHDQLNCFKRNSKDLALLMRMISPWLKLLGVSISEQFLQKVAEKEYQNCLRLLCALYNKLESGFKYNIDIISNSSPFQAHPKLVSKAPSDIRLISSLEEIKHPKVKKYIEMKKRIVETRKKAQIKSEDAPKEYEICSDMNKIPSSFSSSQSLFKRNHSNQNEKEMLKLKMSNLLLHDLCSSLLEKKEQYYYSILQEKMTQQGEYERDLATRLSQVHNKFLYHFPKCSNKPEITITQQDSKLSLHNRLYNLNLIEKKSRHLSICWKIVEDLVDFAVNMGEYIAETNMLPSRAMINDWKELYYKALPILDVHSNESEISLKSIEEDVFSQDSSYDTIFQDLSCEDIKTMDASALKDKNISSRLTEFDVHSYLYLVSEWTVENWPELGTGSEKLNIHGFIVHNLLESKYPLPSGPEAVSLDRFAIRCVIKYFHDPLFLNYLQELLNKSDVIIVGFNDALNYCIEQYDKETAIINIKMSSFLEKTYSKTGKLKRYPKKNIKTSTSLPMGNQIVRFADKAVQCPEVDDADRQVKYSQSAILGKIAQEVIEEGELLSAALKSQIMVEYLKGLEKYKGFVLTDFPNSVSEAVLLEFLITGLVLPNWELDKESKELVYNHSGDVLRDDLGNDDFFIPNFLNETAFEVIPTKYDIKKAKMFEENIEFDNFIEESERESLDLYEEELKDPMNNNESTQSLISYEDESKNKKINFYRELMNLRTSKILPRPKSLFNERGKTIFQSCIANFFETSTSSSSSVFRLVQSIARKESGDNAYQLLPSPLNFFSFYDVLTPVVNKTGLFDVKLIARMILGETNNLQDPLRKSSDALFGEEANKLSQAYSLPRIVSSSTSFFSKSRQKSSKKAKFSSNQDEWKQDSLDPIFKSSPEPNDEDWEYAQETIRDDQAKHLATHWEIVEKVYLQSLNIVMHLLRVDKAKFQPYLNHIRSIIERAIEVPDSRQNLVSQFQSMINSLNDEFRNDSELKAELRCRLHEFWNALCEVTDRKKNQLELVLDDLMSNGWVMGFCQTLVNRFICLMQLELDRSLDTIHILNNYYLLVLKEERKMDSMEKVKLQKVNSINDTTSDSDEVSIKHNVSDKLFTCENFDIMEICRLVQPAMRTAAKKTIQCLNNVKIILSCESVGSELAKERNITNKVAQDNLNIKNVNVYDLNSVDKVKYEWLMVVQNEIDRLSFRIKLIEMKMKDDLTEFVQIAQKMYKNCKTDIIVKYHNEYRAIHQLCKVLRTSIDNGTDIESKLVLDGDRFYLEDIIDPFIHAPPPTPAEELAEDFQFSISQLGRFVTKMSHVSPSGVIGDSFVAILEDMATIAAEQYDPYLPSSWSKMGTNDIKYILSQAFGDTRVYNWKEFVIYNMCLPEPSAEDLVELRRKYKAHHHKSGSRIISFQTFMETPLWFESDNTTNRPKKDILFQLFQTSPTTMKYLLFLLSFCKGEDGLEGFMKALSLMDKRDVLTNVEEYKNRLETEYESQDVVDQIIINLVHNVIQQTEGIRVSTLPNKKRMSSNSFFGEDTSSNISYDSDISFQIIHKLPEPTYPERYNHPKWHICIPHQLVLSLLLFTCRTSLIDSKLQKKLVENLQHLYNSKGKNGHIKGYILGESRFLNDFFELTGSFRWCDMTKLLKAYIGQKVIAESYLNELNKLTMEKMR